MITAVFRNFRSSKSKLWEKIIRFCRPVEFKPVKIGFKPFMKFELIWAVRIQNLEFQVKMFSLVALSKN